MTWEMPIIFLCSGGALVFAWGLARWVLKRDTGTPAMKAISDAIKEGAEAFMRRQNRTIASLALVLAAVIFVLYAYAKGDMQLAATTTVSFILGAACSLIAGYVGMWVSIRANIRTASAARTSLNGALQTALRAGAVSGLFVVAMSLLGVGGLFAVLRAMGEDPKRIPFLIVGYGFGASFVALFAQVGGGIYTKAADVGADLVGKVEAGIPEDDPRNPAVIADLVGDNVGDCAGRGADLFESTAAENIGAMILGVALWPYFGLGGVLFPLVVFGILLAWPWAERRVTGDRAYHNLLQRPRDNPWRTAIGVAVVVWVVMVEVAGVADRTYVFFDISYSSQLWVFRVLVWVLPLVALAVAHRVCVELQKGERVEAERKAAEASAPPAPASPSP